MRPKAEDGGFTEQIRPIKICGCELGAGQEWISLRAGVSPSFSIGLYYSI